MAHTSPHGGHAVAVPGEVKGLWELHQLYGRAEWASLLAPSVKLAREGMVMGRDLYSVSLPSSSGLCRGLGGCGGRMGWWWGCPHVALGRATETPTWCSRLWLLV